MATGKWVSYFRVSTDRQGRSGLGIEAQQAAVTAFLNGGRWTVLGKFIEVESGKNNARPELAKAIAMCRLHGATLLIAKIDRLSRDAHFLLGLGNADVEFIAADMPNANRLTVGIMAMVAEEERRMISARTKAALAAARARGVKLGGDRGAVLTPEISAAGRAAIKARAAARCADLAPLVAQLRSEGITSATGLAKALTERGIPTARGDAAWSAVQVQRVLASIDGGVRAPESRSHTPACQDAAGERTAAEAGSADAGPLPARRLAEGPGPTPRVQSDWPSVGAGGAPANFPPRQTFWKFAPN